MARWLCKPLQKCTSYRAETVELLFSDLSKKKLHFFFFQAQYWLRGERQKTKGGLLGGRGGAVEGQENVPSSCRITHAWLRFDPVQKGKRQLDKSETKHLGRESAYGTNGGMKREVFRHLSVGRTFIPAAAAGPLGSTAWMWHGLLPRTTKPQPTASPTIWRGKPQLAISRRALAICLSFRERGSRPGIKRVPRYTSLLRFVPTLSQGNGTPCFDHKHRRVYAENAVKRHLLGGKKLFL